MPTLKDIRRRITSIEKTQQITRAMRMVAAAKLRRAQESIAAARPYAERMRATLGEVAAAQTEAGHPLLEPRESVRSVELVVFASDRGLAGAFNANALKHADALIKTLDADRISLTCVGGRVSDHYRRRRPDQIDAEYGLPGWVDYALAAGIADRLSRRYASGEVDQVILVFNVFVSTMTQTPRDAQLLPFAPPAKEGEAIGPPHTIEPSPDQLLARLVPKAVEVEIFRALLENQAGEHAARMTAMESATRNTKELIEKLTIDMNRARQAAITRELVEIVTGAQALE